MVVVTAPIPLPAVLFHERYDNALVLQEGLVIDQDSAMFLDELLTGV